jgi:hypothetical protein
MPNWIDINNGESGTSIRSKINTFNTSASLEIDSNLTNVNDLLLRVAALESTVTVLENPSVSSLVTTTPLAQQALVAGVSEKLDWATTELVASGTSVTGDSVNSRFTINEDGNYRVAGVITFQAPINNIVDIELRVNDANTGFTATGIGRDLSNYVTVSYNAITPFLENDEITLWVTSDGDKVVVTSASVTIEKTIY